LSQWANRLDVQQVVCTMKDLVKLRVSVLGNRPLRALTIGIEFLHGREEVEKQLAALTPHDTSRA
jgi:hypothetical protein